MTNANGMLGIKHVRPEVFARVLHIQIAVLPQSMNHQILKYQN